LHSPLLFETKHKRNAMQRYHTGIGKTIAIIEPTFGMKLRMNDSSAKRTASRTLRCVNKPNTKFKTATCHQDCPEPVLAKSEGFLDF